MNREALRGLRAAKPFRPFVLHLADGRSIEIPHPDSLAFHPAGRGVIAFHRQGGSDYLDPLLIVSADVGPDPGGPITDRE